MNIFIEASYISDNWYDACADIYLDWNNIYGYFHAKNEHEDFINMLDGCAFE